VLLDHNQSLVHLGLLSVSTCFHEIWLIIQIALISIFFRQSCYPATSNSVRLSVNQSVTLAVSYHFSLGYFYLYLPSHFFTCRFIIIFQHLGTFLFTFPPFIRLILYLSILLTLSFFCWYMLYSCVCLTREL